MMDVKVFQEKLREITFAAKAEKREFSREKIQQFFQGEELEESQIDKIEAYLKAQTASSGEIQAEECPAAVQVKMAPLSMDEQRYLKDYEESLQWVAPPETRELEKLYQAMSAGKTQAQSRLAQLFLPEVVEIAKRLHTEEGYLGDMIQEGNVALMSALNQWRPDGEPGECLRRRIESGICGIVSQSERQKFEDDILVEKVRKLEAAVRELTEENEEKKFSVEELSILLDMDIDEIRDILRLTGDA